MRYAEEEEKDHPILGYDHVNVLCRELCRYRYKQFRIPAVFVMIYLFQSSHTMVAATHNTKTLFITHFLSLMQW